MTKAITSAEDWQAICTAAFLQAVEQPDTVEARKHWADERDRLDKLGKTEKSNRQVVVGAWDQETFTESVAGRNLSKFDFRFCYFARVDFSGCDLSYARFNKCYFKRCKINNCKVEGASFFGAHADEQTSFKGNTGLRNANLRFATTPVNLKNFDPSVVRWLTALENISSFKEFNKDPIARMANWLTDYGRGVLRLAAFSVFTIVAFASIYGFFFRSCFSVTDCGFPLLVAFVNMSAQRFINAAPAFTSDDNIVQLLFTVEGALGLLSLSLLVATLVNKLVKT